MGPAHPTYAYGRVAVIGARTGWTLFAIALAGYLFTAGGSLTTTDAVVAYALTGQMVDERSLALPGDMLGNEAHRGRDGRYYSPFGLAQSVYNIPFYLGARAVEATGIRVGREGSLRKAAVALGNTVAGAAAVRVAYLFAWQLGGSIPMGVFVGLATAFATPLWPYATFGFNVPLSAWFTTAAVAAAWTAVRKAASPGPVRSGLWVGLALLTRHELGLLVIPIGIWLATGSAGLRQAAGRLASFAAGVVPALLIWLWYNHVRFGNVLDSGYLRDEVPRFWSSPIEGLYGLLLSPTASLFVFCPLAIAGIAALAALWRTDRAAAGLFGGTFLLFLLFYSLFGNWMGGRSYGPRYLVPLLPLLVVPLAAVLPGRPRQARLAFAAIAGASALVQVPGVLVDYAKVSVAHAREKGAPTRQERLFSWSTSPLLLNTVTAVDAVPRNLSWLSGRRPRPAAPAGAGDFSQHFAYSLDLWWLYLFHMRAIGPAATLAICMAFVLTLVVLRARLVALVATVR